MDRVRAALSETYQVQFVIVDDNSPDDSWSVIQQQSESHGDVTAVQHAVNRGHNVALQTGLEHCDSDWVVTMDDDLQHVPEDVPKLLKHAIDNKFDVVFGVFESRKHAFYRNLGSKAYLWFLSRVTGVPKDIRATSFRVLNRRVAAQLRDWSLGQPQASYMIFKVTKNIGNLPVEHQERQYGTSGITLARAARLILDSLVYFSTVPLKLAILLAMSTFGFGILLAANYIYRYYSSEIGVAGFTTTVVLIIGFGASNLLLTAIVGIYVSRLMEELVGRLPPVIRDSIHTSEDDRSDG